MLVSVPGAFTPGCQARHLPPYVGNLTQILEKGVDLVAVIASNDSFVMSAWGKVNGVKVGCYKSFKERCTDEVATGLQQNLVFVRHQDAVLEADRVASWYGRQKWPLGNDHRERWYYLLCSKRERSASGHCKCCQTYTLD